MRSTIRVQQGKCRKELEKKVRTGETVNVEELAAKHGEGGDRGDLQV